MVAQQVTISSNVNLGYLEDSVISLFGAMRSPVWWADGNTIRWAATSSEGEQQRVQLSPGELRPDIPSELEMLQPRHSVRVYKFTPMLHSVWVCSGQTRSLAALFGNFQATSYYCRVQSNLSEIHIMCLLSDLKLLPHPEQQNIIDLCMYDTSWQNVFL